MPRIVVVGGTGTIGSRIVSMLRDQGEDVGVASRASGVDLVSGHGLRDALRGAQVVIDASKTSSTDPRRVREFFSRAGQNLRAVERAVGVEHHIMLSIVGVDRAAEVPFYAAKATLEREIRTSGVPFSILHATQFFEFAGAIARSTTDPRTRVVRLPPLLVQPIAGEDVASAITHLVRATPTMGDTELAGPEQFELDDFVRVVLTQHDQQCEVARDPDSTYFGGSVDREALLPGPDARIATTRLADWLIRAP